MRLCFLTSIINPNALNYQYLHHQGMIDKYGITTVNAPDQELEFDSFTFPKPIALQKSHATSKQNTSIGVTTTSRAVTSKFFIFSGSDVGWIWKADSRTLDPRRPTAKLKPQKNGRISPLSCNSINIICVG